MPQNFIMEQSPLEFHSIENSEYRSDYIVVRDLAADRAGFEKTIERFLNTMSKSLSLSKPNLYSPDSPLTLAEFFKATPRPLSVLLRLTGLRKYLTRPISRVEFTGDAYSPVFSTSEQRIYNLAARANELVSFRYSKNSDPLGDSSVPEPGKENIGHYFAARRADDTACDALTRQLEAESLNQTADLPVHVVNRGGKIIVECLNHAFKHAQKQSAIPQCYVIQTRHDLTSGIGMHFGTLLAILQCGPNPMPLRLIFFDTIRSASGQSPWEKGFKDEIDSVFKRPMGKTPISEMIEDGGVNLWRPRGDLPIRHHDIDCSFHTFTMARALIHIACINPDILLTGHIEKIKHEMTGLMPEYFSGPNIPKSPEEVRAAGILFRWNAGKDYLISIEPGARRTTTNISPVSMVDLGKLPYPPTPVLASQQAPSI